jgi:hypothetical protein
VNRTANFSVLIVILTLAGTGFSEAVNPSWPTGARSSKDWTVMVYLDGDCDLEGYFIQAFLMMASVGSTADVNILVQFDRIDGYAASFGDWTDCKRFYITAGVTPEGYNALAHIGEVNMGDPATLQDFIVWGMSTYPAEKYALLLSDHGDIGGVCADWTAYGDYISCWELYDVMQSVNQSTGFTVDLIGQDACLMAAVEVAYHSRVGSPVMVASQELAPIWPYVGVLSDLVASPTMNATTLGETFVYHYMLLYDGYPPDDPHARVALSAFNLEPVTSDLTPAVNALATQLSQTLPIHAYDFLAAIDATEYESPHAVEPYAADLYHFAQNIKKYVSNLTVQAAAQSVLDAIDIAQIAEWHGTAHSNYHGLYIYLPQTEEAYRSFALVYTMDNAYWVADNIWDEFLRALFVTYAPGMRSQESFSDISFTSFDSNADGYLDALNVTLDVDTTATTCTVAVEACLLDPSDSVVDTDSAVWMVAGSEDEWQNLTLCMPAGGQEGYYDVELLLHDEYGIYEDYHLASNAAYFPEEMQHDVTVSELLAKTVVGQGFPAYINVTISNAGHYHETVNVTTSANGTIIDTTQLNLPSSSTASFTIDWGTQTADLGNYTITSYVEPLDGEANIDDNTLTWGPVLVTLPGDVEGDRDVDIFDMVRMVGDYGKPPPPLTDPNCDIDGDGDVDIFDVVIAAGNYGDSW